MNIKDIVKDNMVNFSRYRQGIMYYTILVMRDMYNGEVYEFPVPLSDVGDATLESSDKAIYFMRYIRKAMEDDTFINIRKG